MSKHPELFDFWTKILLAALAVALVALAWATGFIDWLKAPETLEAYGWWVGLIYFAALAVLGALGVPPAALVVPIGAMWPWPWALLISLSGGMGAAFLGFIFSRYLARDFLEPRIPPRIRRIEEKIEAHDVGSVIVLRLLFFLFPPVTWLLGLSRIPIGHFLLGTFIGFLPGLVIYTFTGDGVMRLLL